MLRYRWRAVIKEKADPMICFAEDPDAKTNLAVQLAKTAVSLLNCEDIATLFGPLCSSSPPLFAY